MYIDLTGELRWPQDIYDDADIDAQKVAYPVGTMDRRMFIAIALRVVKALVRMGKYLHGV